MTIAAVVDLIESLRQAKLLNAQQLEEITALQARFADPRDLARHLIQKGWLTPYQTNQIFQGKAADLVLGQYLILERLGEGGMGQVFKARHLRLERIVALKVIRKEKLDNPKAVKRFQREMRAAAQLVHPNIVLAFDADQCGHTHFFSMEYVQGIDLNRMVKDSGPLPIAQACDYIRQAALGLQHAFERGLVHRDIKPANLLIADLGPKNADAKTVSDSTGEVLINQAELRNLQYGRVKILDMGLARVADSEETNEIVSRLTQEGAVIGTPDFIAPEQAMNSSAADIRADLYSLGCSFHFILTGKVPFPGGTLMEKLIRHRNDAPEPLEKLRPDVPPHIAAIVRKLLAKKPEERFQTPAELVAALDAKTGVTATAPARTVSLDATPAPRGTLSLRPVWPWFVAGALVGVFGLLLLACVIVPMIFRKHNDEKTPNALTKASALDKLDPKQVKREPGTPEDAVAVLGRDGRKSLALAFDSEGRYLASGGDDNMARVWELDSLQESVLSPRHGGRVSGIAFQPRGNLLATTSYDSKLYLWNMAQTGFPIIGSWEADSWEVDVVAFSSNGTVATGGGDHVIRLWRYEHDRMGPPEQLKGHDGTIFALAFSPDGKRLASAGKDRTIRLWDLSGRKAMELGRREKLSTDANSLSFSSDGKVLAGGCADGVVRLWQIEGKELRPADTHTHHGGAVNAVAFSADAHSVASAGQDGQLVVWDLTKQSTRAWSLPPPLRGLAFAPDTRHVAVSAGNGRIYIIRVTPK
jgi:serine/threonine-protein kinase